MAEHLEVPPFLATLDDAQLVFRFDRASFDHGYEYPPNLETLITNVVKSQVSDLSGTQVCIDLEELPAISSKQLGAMLAVRKACTPKGKVQVLNLRPNVRELLQITKLGDFFVWE